MFIKQSSEFDQKLVDDFAEILKKADESTEFKPEDCAKDASTPECDEIDKLQKAVALLSDACSILEEDEKYSKACKKILKAIKIIEKVSKVEAKEITPSDDVEKEVQEEIEEQTEE